jgi:hypothetical protein
MITWSKGKPELAMDIAVVIYMDEYEFARFDGESWEVCSGDGEFTWSPAQCEINLWCELNNPT